MQPWQGRKGAAIYFSSWGISHAHGFTATAAQLVTRQGMQSGIVLGCWMNAALLALTSVPLCVPASITRAGWSRGSFSWAGARAWQGPECAELSSVCVPRAAQQLIYPLGRAPIAKMDLLTLP